ncbi:M20/M25/M40 family metallo-hydrolase, partial [Patescibacteria group bacterium]|nr:M20/M25/M40 family metallo-hydrolase [Patescibacteria group bacterium]MBU1500100.1 M20/M25/M40 family metallo-hydrolase [Patescibacteria group bacterium]
MTDSFLDRLNQCEQTVRLQRRADNKTLVLNRYDLWRQKFYPKDLTENIVKKLSKQYADKLLLPLFQNNPLYAQVNQVNGNARFSPEVCLADFSGKLTAKNPETIFIIMSESDNLTKPMGKLTGDISIFASDPVELYETTLKTGAVGSMTNDTVKLDPDFPSSFRELKCAYFNGIGVAKNYQNLGIGTYLLYQAIKELERRNFEILIIRVMKQANNYRLMKRLSNKTVLTYSNPQFGNDYRVVFSASVKAMLKKLESELKRKFINFGEINNMNAIQIAQKLVSIPSYVDNKTNEAKFALWLVDFFRDFAWLKISKQTIGNNRFNLIVSDGYPAKLIFCSHMDTVQPTNIISLTPTVSNSRLYGLGAVDMKAGIAALLNSVKSLGPTKGLTLIFDCDEEYYFSGTKKILKKFKFKPELVICPEPTDLKIINGCRGCVEVEFLALGKTAHAGNPEAGVNAIEAVTELIKELKLKLIFGDIKKLGKTTVNLSAIRGG